MGTNTSIFLKIKDLPELLEGFRSDFLFLENMGWRWYRFQNYFHLDIGMDTITSKDLFLHIAKTKEKIKEREKWVDLLNKYDIIFQSESLDEKPNEEEWIDIGSFYYRMIDFIKDNVDEIVKIVRGEK